LDKLYSPVYQLIEAKWGTFKSNFKKKNGRLLKAGTPNSGNADEVQQGFMIVQDKNKDRKLNWEYGELDPGWCKLDWLIVEPDRNRVINVSNMLDITRESPKGEIIPLDGQIDPYFQEVYLEASSIPLFTKLKENLTPKKLDDYLNALEKQVLHYLEEENQNYGKVAKRLYNIFRLKGAHKEALFTRELFDEPASALYQVWSLLNAINDARLPKSPIDRKVVSNQIYTLIKNVIKVCEGPEEEKIVDALMKLRDDVLGICDISDNEWNNLIAESRYQIVKLINEYFYPRLKVLPQITTYIEELKLKYKSK